MGASSRLRTANICSVPSSPVYTPGRVRHAHFKITYATGQSLTTQLYVRGETGNDGVLNDITNAAQRESVIVPWTAIPESRTGDLAARFDVVLGFTPSDTPTPSRPTFVTSGIVQGATLNAGAAPGAWLTLFGDGLSSSTRSWRASDFSGTRLPETVDGVGVRINNKAAAVSYVSPRQLNVLVPGDVALGNVQAVVSTAAGTSDAVNVTISQVLPGFFQFGSEYIAAVRADGAYVAPPNLISGVTTVPAKSGDTLLLFGTGFGPVTGNPPTADAFQGAFSTVNPVTVRIGSQQANVSFAGLVSPGLYQFNVTVPTLADGDHPVTAQTNGARTVKLARLRVQASAVASARTRHPRQPDVRQIKQYFAT
jgi:uncharacterized protein (TIGR03437 family)